MANNLYSGYLYPSTPFMFDAVYDNYATATSSATTDGVLIGRFVIVEYCNDCLNANEKLGLEEGTIIPETSSQENYVTNYQIDNPAGTNLKKSYDRMMLQKVYEDGQLQYREIGNLTITFTDKLITDLTNFVKSIKLEYDTDTTNIILSYTDGQESTAYKIDATDFIKDGMIESVKIDKDNRYLVITWNTDAGSSTTEIALDQIVEVYDSGNGVKIDKDNNCFNIDLSTESANYFKFTNKHLDIQTAFKNATTWQTFTKQPTE